MPVIKVDQTLFATNCTSRATFHVQGDKTTAQSPLCTANETCIIPKTVEAQKIESCSEIATMSRTGCNYGSDDLDLLKIVRPLLLTAKGSFLVVTAKEAYWRQLQQSRLGAKSQPIIGERSCMTPLVFCSGFVQVNTHQGLKETLKRVSRSFFFFSFFFGGWGGGSGGGEAVSCRILMFLVEYLDIFPTAWL